MLTMVEARNSLGGVLALPLADATSGYLIEDIEGLDPVKATLVSSEFANLDGSQYQDSSTANRNIIIRLKFKPEFTTGTVRDLRNRLYGFFMPKAEVRLRFYLSDGLAVSISGRIESFDAPLFTKTPRADISIVCFDPDLVDTNRVIIDGMTSSSTSDDAGRLTIPYAGTAEAGVKFQLSLGAGRSLGEFTIYHRAGSDIARTLNFEMPLTQNNQVRIVTVPGAKEAVLINGSTETSALWAVSPQSTWFKLQQGENYIRVYATGAPIPYVIEYNTKYGGL